MSGSQRLLHQIRDDPVKGRQGPVIVREGADIYAKSIFSALAQGAADKRF